MAQHHNGLDAKFAATLQPGADERRTQALALKQGPNGDWRQRRSLDLSLRPGDSQLAEQDMADDVATAFGHQRCDEITVIPQSIHQVRLIRLAECLRVNLPYRRQIGWRLGADGGLGWHGAIRALQRRQRWDSRPRDSSYESVIQASLDWIDTEPSRRFT